MPKVGRGFCSLQVIRVISLAPCSLHSRSRPFHSGVMLRRLLGRQPSRYAGLDSSTQTPEDEVNEEIDESNGGRRASPSNCRRERSPTSTSAPLRRVPGKLPLSAWLVIIIEACERFCYFGLAGPLQNYLQNRPDNPIGPGGLGESLLSIHYLYSVECRVDSTRSYPSKCFESEPKLHVLDLPYSLGWCCYRRSAPGTINDNAIVVHILCIRLGYFGFDFSAQSVLLERFVWRTALRYVITRYR